MKANGKIEGSVETTAFQAFYWLTANELSNESPPPKVIGEVADLLTGRSTAPLNPNATRVIYTKMKQAYDKLQKLQPEVLAQKGLSLGRLKLFQQTLNDIKIAVDQKKQLDWVETTHLIPLKQAGEKQWSTLQSRFNLAPLPDIFKGRLVFVKNRPSSDKLIIFFPDFHNYAETQRKIRADILALAGKGLNLQGMETWWGDLDFVKEYSMYPESNMIMYTPPKNNPYQPVNMITTVVQFKPCIEGADQYIRGFDQSNRSIRAVVAVECLLGDKIDTIGIEEQSINQRRMARYTQQPPDMSRPIDRFKYFIKIAEADDEAEKKAVEILTRRMDEKNEKIAAMEFGLSHVNGIVAALDAAGVSYAVFDVNPEQ